MTQLGATGRAPIPPSATALKADLLALLTHTLPIVGDSRLLHGDILSFHRMLTHSAPGAVVDEALDGMNRLQCVWIECANRPEYDGGECVVLEKGEEMQACSRVRPRLAAYSPLLADLH